MSELINKDPMSFGNIIDKSVNFIFKNICWITPIGFIISLTQLSSMQLMPSILISMVLTSFLAGTVSIIIGEQFLGHNISWYQGFQKSTKKWINLVLLSLVVAIVVWLGCILLIIPGIIAMCATACAIPAMMLEDLDPMKAVDRSWELTKNNRFWIFAFSCLDFLIAVFAAGVPAVITNGLSMDPIYKVGLTALILAPVHALWPAITTLLFFDLRIRKEAMDLEEETKTTYVAMEEVD